MKTILTMIFTFVLTAIIIIGGAALYIAKENPYNIQACIISSFLSAPDKDGSDSGEVDGKKDSAIESTKESDHPLLSDKQEEMLEDLGVDVSTLPASISPEMEACAIDKLGKERVQEIMDGDMPGPLEIFKARSCLE